MKKIISIIIATVLLLSTFATASFANSNPFTDVSEKAWYYDEVMSAFADGIMVGTSKTEFEPEATVTREMFVTALARTFEIDVSSFNTQFFADQKQGKWYYNALSWGATETVNIASGIGTNASGGKIFGVGAPVTREQMATFIYRLLGNNYLTLAKSDKAPEGFLDSPSKWAVSAVDTIRESGIISGYTDGTFKPTKNATRAEVAAILVRLKAALKNATAKFEFSVPTLIQIGNNDPVTDANEIGAIVDAINSATVTKAEYLKIYGYEEYRDYLEGNYTSWIGILAGVNLDWQIAVVEDGILFNYYHYALDSTSLDALNALIK